MKIFVLLLAALLLTGCSYRSYRHGDIQYTSWSFGTSQTVAPFSLKAGKKDDPSYRELESKGLSNSPDAAIIEAAVGAAVRAGRTP